MGSIISRVGDQNSMISNRNMLKRTVQNQEPTADSMINPNHIKGLPKKISNKRLTKKEQKEIAKIDRLALPKGN